jgi:hypothetical protein
MDSAETIPPTTAGFSGKLVIIGIVTIAFWAAAISWYFRYNATHHAAKFWGPETSVLIRDAPVVGISHNGVQLNSSTPAEKAHFPIDSGIDVSNAHGLVYLRNALLEDHNFDWSTLDKAEHQGGLTYWVLEFSDPKTGKEATFWISDDFRYSTRIGDLHESRSVAHSPQMTKGLREMFTEFTAEARQRSVTEESPTPAR